MPQAERDVFDQHMRPARMFLRLYQLLEHHEEHPSPEGLLDEVRQHLHLSTEEALDQIRNAAFLGFIRPGQDGTLDLSDAERANLLRHAIVVCCSATEIYLRNLLEAHLEKVARARGPQFINSADADLMRCLNELFRNTSFACQEVVVNFTRTPPEQAIWLSARILQRVRQEYVKGRDGVAVVGKLLGVTDPWASIEAAYPDLSQPDRTFNRIARRRREIIHHGDCAQDTHEPCPINGEEVGEWVAVTRTVCYCLDDLIVASLNGLTPFALP